MSVFVTKNIPVVQQDPGGAVAGAPGHVPMV